MQRKPKYLPQMSAPFEYVVDGLKREGVVYKDVTLQPNDILPSQKITFLDTIDIDKNKKIDPIWVAGESDDENVVIDGHHRWVDFQASDKPIRCIKIELKPNDASRVLNKIQDIYEYEQSVGLEEVVAHQRNINDRNDAKSNDWLGTVLEQSKKINKDKKNPIKLIGYRDKPINENSLVGNFFSLNKLPECDKYEIEFDNLLDTKEIGVNYKDGQKPLDVITMLWFPGINFNELSEEHQMPVENIKSKIISEYAKRMGFDGIKYGDIMVQGFK